MMRQSVCLIFRASLEIPQGFHWSVLLLEWSSTAANKWLHGLHALNSFFQALESCFSCFLVFMDIKFIVAAAAFPAAAGAFVLFGPWTASPVSSFHDTISPPPSAALFFVCLCRSWAWPHAMDWPTAFLVVVAVSSGVCVFEDLH